MQISIRLDGKPIIVEGGWTTADTIIRHLGGRVPSTYLDAGGWTNYYVILVEPDVPYWERKQYFRNDLIQLRGGEDVWVVPVAYAGVGSTAFGSGLGGTVHG